MQSELCRTHRPIFGEGRERNTTRPLREVMSGHRVSFPISGVDEAARLWTRTGHWNSRDTLRLELNLAETREETISVQSTQPPSDISR